MNYASNFQKILLIGFWIFYLYIIFFPVRSRIFISKKQFVFLQLFFSLAFSFSGIRKWRTFFCYLIVPKRNWKKMLRYRLEKTKIIIPRISGLILSLANAAKVQESLLSVYVRVFIFNRQLYHIRVARHSHFVALTSFET